jgi:hypothetical protein
MTPNNGLRSIIYDLLPDHKPGMTYSDLRLALETTTGVKRSYKSVGKVIHFMRCADQIRDDGQNPKHFWRGPKVAQPRPYCRAEPRAWWTRPSAELLAECRVGREEIRSALKR